MFAFLTPLLTMLVPALIPAATDTIRAVVNRITGGAGAQPTSVAETVQLTQADTARLEAVAKLDAVGQTSQWVNNIRALQRPAIGFLVLVAYLYSLASYGIVSAALADLTTSVIFYLFGDRTYMYLRRDSK